MTNSALWVGYPKSYTAGRTRPIQFVTLHYTAGSEGPTSAESGAQYDKVRTDGTSTHYFTDSLGPALQEVPDGDRSHAARFHGNEIGIQIEICGTLQTRAQWLDPVSLATLQTTAWLVATLLQRHGLAFQRLTVEQTRAAYYATPGARPTGINDHNAVTLAFPEDQGTHTDVGPDFPWDVFMKMVADQLAGGQEEMWFFQFKDLRIGRANGCTWELAGSEQQWQQWQADYKTRTGVPPTVLYQVDPTPYLDGTKGHDVTGVNVGSGGGITLAQVNAQIAASTLHPPAV